MTLTVFSALTLLFFAQVDEFQVAGASNFIASSQNVATAFEKDNYSC
ncbi:MAG: hypothetical protein LBV77_04490 [Candidatus Adiutrix intracellularis]|nr:hypothetical protein [Candidatus Adiutrix intracellularis]